MTPQDAASIEDALRQQESLRVIIESISSELDLRPLLTRIVRHACELLGAENGTIGLVDSARNVVRTEAVYRMPPDELGSEMAVGVGLAGQVLLTGQPVVLNRYGEVDSPLQPGLVDFAVIGMPIFWRGRMIGFFGLGSPPPRRFDPADIERLSLFAKHAAIAIINARLFEETQQALGEMHLLYATSHRMTAALDVSEVIAAYLDQVAARGRYACTVALYERDEQGRKSAVNVRGLWSKEQGRTLLEFRVPYTYDALDAPLDTGQTVTIADVFTDKRVSEPLRDLQRQSGRPALAMVPLMVRGERIGLVILSYPTVHDWSDDDLRLYQATAAQLALAIDNRMQVQLLYERGQQLAVLEERQRLARDLHDSVTQLLFGITLIAQSLTPAWKRSAEEGESRVERLLELSRAASAEMRALLAELRPADTSASAAPPAPAQRSDLIAKLREHVARMNLEGVPCLWETQTYAPQSQETEEILLRVAQEAFANALKYAQAKQISISLATTPTETTLTITDDGVGFDVSQRLSRPVNPRAGGMGLPGMRERLEACGGTFQITSAPGVGTTIKARIPGKDGESWRESVS